MVAWYFQRKLNRNANQLKTLRAEKKKIIEQVMDKETYKVALEILNRFADSTTRMQHQQTVGVARKPTNISVWQNQFGQNYFFFFHHRKSDSIASECDDNANKRSAKTRKQFNTVHTTAATNVDAATTADTNQCTCLASTANQ